MPDLWGFLGATVRHVSNNGGGEGGFGEFLRAARVRAKMSPAELAAVAGLNQTQVSNWETGKNQPNVTNLRRLSKALNVALLRLMVEAGHLSRSEAQLADGPVDMPRPVTVPDAIDDDPDLLEEAKAHLLNQYELLLRIDGRSPDLRKKSQARMESLRTDVRGQQRPRVKEQERGTGTHGDD